MQARNYCKIKPEGKGIKNAMYILPTGYEQALEIQKEVHVYSSFNDYTIVFDRAPHEMIT